MFCNRGINNAIPKVSNTEPINIEITRRISSDLILKSKRFKKFNRSLITFINALSYKD